MIRNEFANRKLLNMYKFNMLVNLNQIKKNIIQMLKDVSRTKPFINKERKRMMYNLKMKYFTDILLKTSIYQI